jgi:hypothetical protein
MGTSKSFEKLAPEEEPLMTQNLKCHRWAQHSSPLFFHSAAEGDVLIPWKTLASCSSLMLWGDKIGIQSHGSTISLKYASSESASEAYHRMLSELEEIWKARGLM